jgi:hypothetical protein
MSESELGGVGEGLCGLDRAQPLTQLQLGNELPSLHNPLKRRGIMLTIYYETAYSCCTDTSAGPD